MNKSFVKFVTDFGPLLVFFFFYYNSDKNLKIAIPPFIIATLIALIVVWLLEKKVPMVPLIGGILITLFGGLTIYFDNPVFIYIKPSSLAFLILKFSGNTAPTVAKGTLRPTWALGAPQTTCVSSSPNPAT